MATATKNPFQGDPYPFYRDIRDRDGLTWFPHHEGRGMWLVCRYDDVTALLKEARTTKRAVNINEHDPADMFANNLLALDPPDHTRVRRVANGAISHERFRALAPRVRAITAEIIETLRSETKIDFVKAFAQRLPALVMAELLGVPAKDREAFRILSMQVLSGMDVTSTDNGNGKRAVAQLGYYFSQLATARRRVPCDDLITVLVQASEDAGHLTQDEVICLCMLLLIAGTETTINMLANGMYTLLMHPDQLTLLKQDPALWPGALEEILRYESPVQRATFRAATQDLTIGGTKVASGEQLSAVLGSANRDERYFSNAHVFDITRKNNRHVAFGSGIHVCSGPAIARLEGCIAFEALTLAFPAMQLRHRQPCWDLAATAVRRLTSLEVNLKA